MNEAFITIVGFIVLGLFIYSAFSEKINVQFAFIIFPVVGAVVLGFGFDELKEWMIKGIENNASIIGFVVFTCSFFQLMNDVGAFDGIVDFIIERSGSNIMAICLSGWLIAIISSIDGAAPSTVLVTTSAMMPVYKKVKIRPIYLGLQMALAVSFMGLLPFSGKSNSFAAALGSDPSEVFSHGGLSIALIVGLVFSTILVIIYGQNEVRRISEGKNDYLMESAVNTTSSKSVTITSRHQKMRIPNLLLIITLLFFLITGIISSLVISAICCSLAFILNYVNSFEQQQEWRNCASTVLTVIGLFIAAGPFIQIMNGTGMMSGIVNFILVIIPTSFASRLHVIASFFYTPIDCFFSSSVPIYGLSPVIFTTANTAACISSTQAHAIFMCGDSPALLCSISGPAVYLMLEMLGGVKLRDFAQYALPPLWSVSIVMIIAMIILGYAF